MFSSGHLRKIEGLPQTMELFNIAKVCISAKRMNTLNTLLEDEQLFLGLLGKEIKARTHSVSTIGLSGH